MGYIFKLRKELAVLTLASVTSTVYAIYSIIDTFVQRWSTLRGAVRGDPGCINYRVFVLPRVRKRKHVSTYAWLSPGVKDGTTNYTTTTGTRTYRSPNQSRYEYVQQAWLGVTTLQYYNTHHLCTMLPMLQINAPGLGGTSTHCPLSLTCSPDTSSWQSTQGGVDFVDT